MEPLAPDRASPDEAVSPAEPTAPPRGAGRIGRYPFGLIAVVILRLLDAASLLYLALGATTRPIGGVPIIASDTTLTRGIDLFFAGLVVVGVIGLLLFQRWGWVLTMVLVGVALCGDLIRVAIGEPSYIGLLLHVLAAFYLNGRSVRALASQNLEHDPRRQP